MARVENTNYRAEADTDFYYATDDADAFDRFDVSKATQALDRHDHSDGRGLPVARTGANSVSSTSIQADAVTPDTKIPTITVDPTQVPTDNADRLTVLLGQIVNRIKVGFGTTNWYDTPVKILTEKVSKSGDQMTGVLASFVDTRHAPAVGGVDETMYQRASFIASVSSSIAAGAYPAIAWHREGLTAVAMYQFTSGRGRLHIVDQDGTVAQVLTQLDEGSGNGLDADTLRTLIPGNSSGNIALNNNTENDQLYAYKARRAVDVGTVVREFGNSSGNVPVSNGATNANLVAQYAVRAIPAGGSTGTSREFSNASGDIPISNSVMCSGLFAAASATLLVSGSTFASIGHSSGNIPISDGVLNTNLNAEMLGGSNLAAVLAAAGRQASGTYTGDGTSAAGGRQITTGFLPKFVIIYDVTSGNNQWDVGSASGAFKLSTGAGAVDAGVGLHASDGFSVGKGTTAANVNTNSYTYVAFG